MMQTIENIPQIKISYSNPQKASERTKILTSITCDMVLRPSWQDIGYRETFKIILLDRTLNVLGISTIGEGGLAGCVSDIRMIFQVALQSNAHAIIIAHNHPSGTLAPSEHDIKITNKIKRAGRILEIALVDAIILTEESYFSFGDNHIL